MNIREIELPGIGKKFECITSSGDKIVAIIHEEGRREIYVVDKKDEDEFLSNVSLDDHEARQFASIIGGMIYKPKELELEKDMSLSEEFGIRWCKVEKEGKIVNKSILESDLKKIYEIMIIGVIKKDDTKNFNPGPETIFEEGDTVVISGDKKKIKAAYKELFCKGGG